MLVRHTPQGGIDNAEIIKYFLFQLRIAVERTCAPPLQIRGLIGQTYLYDIPCIRAVHHRNIIQRIQCYVVILRPVLHTRMDDIGGHLVQGVNQLVRRTRSVLKAPFVFGESIPMAFRHRNIVPQVIVPAGQFALESVRQRTCASEQWAKQCRRQRQNVFVMLHVNSPVLEVVGFAETCSKTVLDR